MDTTINFLLNHPMEHKLATYRYHITRMHSLPLTLEQKQTEWTLIQPTEQNNNFLRKIILNLNQKIKHKKSSQDENYGDKNKIWTTFTYYSPKIRKITNLFKQTKIGIAFKSTNTIQQLMKQKQTSNTQEINKSGIYKLKSNTCQMAYVGHTSRSLRQRYQEQIRYIKYNKPQSAYKQHILNNRHEYGPIDKIMSLLK